MSNVVNDIVTVYRYNAQNKLARIEGQGFSYDFLYDSLNRRIASRRNSEDWRFDIHDGAVCIASVTNSTMERFFVRGAGIAEGTGDVLAEIRGSDAYSATAVFYVVNHRGDTLNAYVSGIGLIASYRYDAFGNVIQFSCAAGCTNLLPRYTFSTKEYLPDAKVYLYAYRVYDPIAGRWTQRDPIDYQDSVNLYCFCGNNPANNIDPFGLKEKDPDKDTPGPNIIEQGANENPVSVENVQKDMANAYNCYSHVFFNTQGDGSSKKYPRTASHKSAEDKLAQMEKLDDNADNKVGDVVAYYVNGTLVHVGKVTEVNNGYATRIESKFGAGPLISHHPRQTREPNKTSDAYPGTTRVYYRAKSVTCPVTNPTRAVK